MIVSFEASAKLGFVRALGVALLVVPLSSCGNGDATKPASGSDGTSAGAPETGGQPAEPGAAGSMSPAGDTPAGAAAGGGSEGQVPGGVSSMDITPSQPEASGSPGNTPSPSTGSGATAPVGDGEPAPAQPTVDDAVIPVGTPAGEPVDRLAACTGGPFAEPLLDAAALTSVEGSEGTGQGGRTVSIAEGPVWVAGAVYFSLFSTEEGFPSTIKRYVLGGTVEDFIVDSGSNGLAIDVDGHLLAATHDLQALSKYDLLTRERSIVVGDYMGQLFNSPNDVAVHSNGTIYFTDPNFQNGGRESVEETYLYVVQDGVATAVLTPFEVPEVVGPIGTGGAPNGTGGATAEVGGGGGMGVADGSGGMPEGIGGGVSAAGIGGASGSAGGAGGSADGAGGNGPGGRGGFPGGGSFSPEGGPNGVVLSLDETMLYVSGTGAPMTRYPVNPDGTLGEGTAFADDGEGGDGMTLDCLGNVYLAIRNEVRVFTSEGELLGSLRTPGQATNVAFGGADGMTLFITTFASNAPGLHMAELGVPGLPY